VRSLAGPQPFISRQQAAAASAASESARPGPLRHRSEASAIVFGDTRHTAHPADPGWVAFGPTAAVEAVEGEDLARGRKECVTVSSTCPALCGGVPESTRDLQAFLRLARERGQRDHRPGGIPIGVRPIADGAAAAAACV